MQTNLIFLKYPKLICFSSFTQMFYYIYPVPAPFSFSFVVCSVSKSSFLTFCQNFLFLFLLCLVIISFLVRALSFFNFLFLSKKATSVTLSNFQVAFSTRGRLFSPPLPTTTTDCLCTVYNEIQASFPQTMQSREGGVGRKLEQCGDILGDPAFLLMLNTMLH